MPSQLPKTCTVKDCQAKPLFIDPWNYCPDHGIVLPKDWNHHYRGWYARS